MQGPLLFKWDFALRASDLLLTYEVTNNAQADLFVLSKLPRYIPEFEINPDIVYVQLGSFARTVEIYKNYPRMPKEEGCEVLTVYGDVVRAGDTFREQVRVSLPIWAMNPYVSMKAPRKSKPVTYNLVYFSLGYWWATPGLKEEIMDVQGHPIITQVGGSPVTADQMGVLETARVELRLPVLEDADR